MADNSNIKTTWCTATPKNIEPSYLLLWYGAILSLAGVIETTQATAQHLKEVENFALQIVKNKIKNKSRTEVVKYFVRSYKVLPWFDLWGVQFRNKRKRHFIIYQCKIPTWSKNSRNNRSGGWFVENNRVLRWEKCFIFKHRAWVKVNYSVKKTLNCERMYEKQVRKDQLTIGVKAALNFLSYFLEVFDQTTLLYGLFAFVFDFADFKGRQLLFSYPR